MQKLPVAQPHRTIICNTSATTTFRVIHCGIGSQWLTRTVPIICCYKCRIIQNDLPTQQANTSRSADVPHYASTKCPTQTTECPGTHSQHPRNHGWMNQKAHATKKHAIPTNQGFVIKFHLTTLPANALHHQQMYARRHLVNPMFCV